MDISKRRELWHQRLSRVINSAICFSLAYILLTYLSWLIMGYTGTLFKYSSFVYYYGIKFILNDHKWTKSSVTLIYSSGFLFCLVVGVLGFFLFERLKHIKTMFNIFLLWCFIIGTSIFTAQGIIACLGTSEYLSPFYQNLAVVYAWWHVPAPVVYLLEIPIFVLFLFCSVNYAKPFLPTSFSFSKVNSESRRKKYFFEVAVLPFLLGAIITTAITFPMNIFVHALYLFVIAVGLLIAWLSLVYIRVPKDDMLRYTTLQTLNPVFLFLLLFMIILVFMGWRGINISV